MEKNKRLSVSEDLEGYCVLSPTGSMEVTDWTNGEGFDIDINDRHFNLTWGQWKLLKKLVKRLDKWYE